MRYAIIINPAAKSGKSKIVLPKIKAFFKRNKVHLDILKTQKAGDAITLAKKATKDHDVIIAAGGDGTINEVLNGIAGTKSALGIIPMGTANVLAIELQIPENVIEACRVLIENRPQYLDIGNINGRYFLSWAGIGLHSQMIEDTEKVPLLKLALGKIAYPLSGLKTLLTYTPPKMSIKIDKKDYSGYFVLIGNIKYYGGKFKVLPKASTNDGLLDVCIFKKKNLLHNFKYTLAMGLGQHVRYEDVDYVQAKKITVESYKRTPIHVDAELVSHTPAKIYIKSKFLRIILPKEYVQEL